MSRLLTPDDMRDKVSECITMYEISFNSVRGHDWKESNLAVAGVKQ